MENLLPDLKWFDSHRNYTLHVILSDFSGLLLQKVPRPKVAVTTGTGGSVRQISHVNTAYLVHKECRGYFNNSHS